MLCGRSVRQYTPGGESATLVIPGANAFPITPASQALGPGITHLVVQNEIAHSITLEYVNTAHASGIPVIFNPAPLPSEPELRAFPWHKVACVVLAEEDAELVVARLGLDGIPTRERVHREIEERLLLPKERLPDDWLPSYQMCVVVIRVDERMALT